MSRLTVGLSTTTPLSQRQASGRLHLAKGAVLRLEWGSSAPLVVVCRGTVWATTTPAHGDWVIQTGETLLPGGRGPAVVEALAPTDLLVIPREDAAHVRASAVWTSMNAVRRWSTALGSAIRRVSQWLLDRQVDRMTTRGSIREASGGS
ncbi:MAG: DUF2917 domain-containing protein [Vicinamibacterales bacterium]